MNSNEIFLALQNGGSFSLPYLIKLSHPNAGVLYFVNNNEDIFFNEKTYKASAFNYTKPQTMGGVLKNGSLEISIIDNAVIDLIEQSDELFTMEVTGILYNGEVTPLKYFKHQYGTATISEEMKLVISFKNDDRLEMVFPPYEFDSENNRGNS